MRETVLKVEDVTKIYAIGSFGYGSLRRDLSAWWSKIRRKENPESRLFGDGPSHCTAVDRVSFAVRRGEILGIVGDNGAGKSTLLRIISRITAPTAGTVKIRGKLAAVLEAGAGFHVELTGRENIYLNGAILGMNAAVTRNRIDEIIAFAEIEKYIDTPVKRYSSGMYVRLAFSVAAHLDADILILDEVLAMSDGAFQQKCFDKIKRSVASDGKTVLFVSHDLSAVETLCSRAVQLADGKVVATGEPHDIVRRYRKV